MFDWDDDVGDLYKSRKVGYESAAPTKPDGNGRILRATAFRWIVPAAIVAALLSAGIGVFGPGLQSGRVSQASLGTLGSLVLGPQSNEPPAELVAYGPEQFQNFMRAMTDFTDHDLLEYAAVTARDLGGYADPATPFMLDVLLLTHREIERRGLRSPTASLQHDAMRDSFRGAQAAL